MRSLFTILALCAATVAQAQVDPMDTQRCIWSCLANSPGASSPQYQQCANRYCNVPPARQAVPVVPPASDWSSGIASDGVHRFAGTQAEQGYGFYYFCKADQSFFTLGELPVGAGQYRLIIGTIEYIVPFDMARGVPSVNIPPGHALVTSLRTGGDMLTIRAMDQTHLIRFSLRGADAGLGQAIEACF